MTACVANCSNDLGDLGPQCALSKRVPKCLNSLRSDKKEQSRLRKQPVSYSQYRIAVAEGAHFLNSWLRRRMPSFCGLGMTCLRTNRPRRMTASKGESAVTIRTNPPLTSRHVNIVNTSGLSNCRAPQTRLFRKSKGADGGFVRGSLRNRFTSALRLTKKYQIPIMYVFKHLQNRRVKGFLEKAPKRQRDREATERDLVTAAAVAFAEKGYEKATTRSIAEAAGCSEGLIQRYFNGKEGLLLAVLKHQGSAQRDKFFERPLCATLADEARELITHGMAVCAERSERIRIVLSRVLLDRAFQADFQRISMRQDVRRSLMQRLGRYVDAGMIDPNMDLDMLTELLLSQIFQLAFVHRELHQTKATDIQRMAEGFATLFVRGVAPIPIARQRAKKT